jgi:hypothetical protein
MRRTPEGKGKERKGREGKRGLDRIIFKFVANQVCSFNGNG